MFISNEEKRNIYKNIVDLQKKVDVNEEHKKHIESTLDGVQTELRLTNKTLETLSKNQNYLIGGLLLLQVLKSFGLLTF